MPLPQPPADNTPDSATLTIGPLELFLAFSQLALSGFGGVLPWAHRTLVERKGWLTQREFVETLAMRGISYNSRPSSATRFGRRTAAWGAPSRELRDA